VQYQGAGIGLHMLKRDFFITVLQTPIVSLLPLFALVYLGAFFFWGIIYYLIVRCAMAVLCVTSHSSRKQHRGYLTTAYKWACMSVF
jgi:hypothetical protein